MQFGKAKPVAINLALQGGGAHGAFTWGVLDTLLEDGRLEFEGISGTSAGAMNATVLAYGLQQGGREGARQALARFWATVAESLPFDVALPSLDGTSVKLAPTLKLMLHWAHYFTPDQLNPFDLNPLRDIVEAQIDFARLRRLTRQKLFISATNANSGKLRVFRTHEMTADAVLASACLPTIHRTIEIDGEPYWDGGYAANPAVFPLFHECDADDILLVLLTPLQHKTTPGSVKEIKDRMLEIAFNSTFLREMRMFAELREHVGHSWLPALSRFERKLSRAHFHVIEAEDAIGELPTETKLAANLWFFERLRDLGRERARGWLDQHFGDIGKRSSADLAGMFC